MTDQPPILHLAAPRGFCAGVERAIEVVELALRVHGRPVYVRHEIVHNRHVVEELRARGAVFTDDLADVPAGAVLVDGHELSYGYRDRPQFAAASRTMKEDLLPLVADARKYREILSVGFGLWLDHDWRNKGWSETDPSKNYFTPDALEAVRATCVEAANALGGRIMPSDAEATSMPQKNCRSLMP